MSVTAFAPMHTNSPRPPSVPVWFTIAVPNAAKGHGEPPGLRSLSAEIARRIQKARVDSATGSGPRSGPLSDSDSDSGSGGEWAWTGDDGATKKRARRKVKRKREAPRGR